jgi:fused signal recognition particle receptor
MQLEWLDLSPMATWTLLFLVAFFTLGGVALVRLQARRRAALAAYTDAPESAEDAAAADAAADAGPPADAEVNPAVAAFEAPAAASPPIEVPDVRSAAATTPAVVAPVIKAPPGADAAAFSAGLARTQEGLLGRIGKIFRGRTAIDSAVLDDIEEVLLTADVGVGMAMRLMDALRDQHAATPLRHAEDVWALLRAQMQAALLPSGPQGTPLETAVGVGDRPKVVLFVGVNGVGKTTTIGKLAARFAGAGHQVLLAAGDTFRAAAAEQLTIWGERTGARVVRGDAGADPASVMFNAVEAAKQGNFDLVLADTAGRLHTKVELMDEIKKVRRAIGKVQPGAPDETWLVVDATTGQNALQQAKEFHQALTLTGVILTKLEGTAKGGIIVAIVDALKIPVVYVGVGEKADDLLPFAPDAFVSALFAPPGNA